LRDSLPYLAHETLHIEILEYKANDGVCEKVRRRQGEHDTRCDVDERLVKIRRKLNNRKYMRKDVKMDGRHGTRRTE
jgi:hypothetical protein